MMTTSVAGIANLSRVTLLAFLWVALAVTELLVVSYLFEFTSGLPDQQNPVYYVTRTARWVVVTIPVFAILVWSERQSLIGQWSTLCTGRNVARALTINLALFAGLAMASAALSAYAATAATPPWHLLSLLLVLLAATALSLIGIVLPLRGLAALGWGWRHQLLAAAAVGLGIVVLAEITIRMWQNLAGATLTLSAAILSLYESNVIIDPIERTIRVGNFGVAIWDTCSGFEGLALVAGFVSVYLWTFRKELRFPQALLLYPVGLAASWLLNSLRIAALTSIGAHFSPEMAVKGFHSQAGWIAFLAVTLGLMSLAGRWRLVTMPERPVEARANSAPVRYDETVAHLLPFVALMLGSMAMAATAPHDRPVYAIKVLFVAAALWLCRGAYGNCRAAVSAPAVATGVLVGALWIATSPATESGEALGRWLVQIGPELAVGWLIVRGLGTIVLVPIAEELAFRGYLYRRIIARDFHTIAPTTLSLVALAVSSLLFGVLHDRWLAASLAGVAFALVMLRSGRLADAIVAHATANALIFIWALAFRQWSLL